MVRTEYRWWLAEFGAGTGVGLILGFIVNIQLGVGYGILVALIFFVLRETVRLRSEMFVEVQRVGSELDEKVSNWERKALNLPHVLPYLTPADPFFAQQVRISMDELGKLARGAAEGELVLKPRNIHQYCIEILKQANAGDEVFATTYVNPEFFWCTPEGAHYRQNCNTLVKKKVSITRVFIVPTRASDKEIECIDNEIELQKGSGVKVKKVQESDLPVDARKDFLLIQDKYVAYLGIGGRGDILVDLKVYNDEQELKSASALADIISQRSQEC